MAQSLQRRLSDAGHEVIIAASTAGGDTWIEPVLEGADALAVVGGDGTVRSVVDAASRARVPLVHVPMGTENLLARGLRMSRDPSAVLETLERGRRVDVDLAQANGEAMVLMASAGLDAAIVADVTRRRRRSISRWIYVRSLLRQLPRWRAPRMWLQVDGVMHVDGQRGWIVVANAPDYGGRFDPAPMAVLDDGLLDVVFLPCRGSARLAVWAMRARMGRHGRSPAALVCRGRSVDVRFDAAADLQIDGDLPWGEARSASLNVEIGPHPITLIVPPHAGALRALGQSPAEAST